MLLDEGLCLFTGGLGNSLGNNLTLGVLPRARLSHATFFGGQKLGDGLSLGLGAVALWLGEGKTFGGGVMMVTSGGILVPVAAPLSASGLAVTSHGNVVLGKTLLEFSKRKEADANKVKGSVKEKKAQFKSPKGNLNGKEAAKDIPDWV